MRAPAGRLAADLAFFERRFAERAAEAAARQRARMPHSPHRSVTGWHRPGASSTSSAELYAFPSSLRASDGGGGGRSAGSDAVDGLPPWLRRLAAIGAELEERLGVASEAATLPAAAGSTRAGGVGAVSPLSSATLPPTASRAAPFSPSSPSRPSSSSSSSSSLASFSSPAASGAGSAAAQVAAAASVSAGGALTLRLLVDEELARLGDEALRRAARRLSIHRHQRALRCSQQRAEQQPPQEQPQLAVEASGNAFPLTPLWRDFCDGDRDDNASDDGYLEHGNGVSVGDGRYLEHGGDDEGDDEGLFGAGYRQEAGGDGGGGGNGGSTATAPDSAEAAVAAAEAAAVSASASELCALAALYSQCGGSGWVDRSGGWELGSRVATAASSAGSRPQSPGGSGGGGGSSSQSRSPTSRGKALRAAAGEGAGPPWLELHAGVGRWFGIAVDPEAGRRAASGTRGMLRSGGGGGSGGSGGVSGASGARATVALAAPVAEVRLAFNSLIGRLPGSALGSLAHLVVLDLQHNQLVRWPCGRGCICTLPSSTSSQELRIKIVQRFDAWPSQFNHTRYRFLVLPSLSRCQAFRIAAAGGADSTAAGCAQPAPHAAPERQQPDRDRAPGGRRRPRAPPVSKAESSPRQRLIKGHVLSAYE